MAKLIKYEFCCNEFKDCVNEGVFIELCDGEFVMLSNEWSTYVKPIKHCPFCGDKL